MWYIVMTVYLVWDSMDHQGLTGEADKYDSLSYLFFDSIIHQGITGKADNYADNIDHKDLTGETDRYESLSVLGQHRSPRSHR